MKTFVTIEGSFDDSTIQQLKEASKKHNVEVSITSKGGEAGPLNAPIDLGTVVQVIKIITLAFQAGTAGVAFIREVLKALKPHEKIVVKTVKGDVKATLTSSASDDEIAKAAA
ncbi:MAG TPA: hypothetical protein VGD65_11110 [Chryseosolibacter sp.]